MAEVSEEYEIYLLKHFNALRLDFWPLLKDNFPFFLNKNILFHLVLADFVFPTP